MKTHSIHTFARLNDIHGIRTALTSGVDVDEKDKFGSTALHCAIAKGSSDAARELLVRNADAGLQNREGMTALHYAAEYGLLEAAELILQRQPKVTQIPDNFGNEALWIAAFRADGDFRMVELIVRCGGDPKHVNKSGVSPLDFAKRKGDEELVRVLEGGTRAV